MPARSHGESGTRLYYCWKNIKARCYGGYSNRYYCYGAVGIKVCKSWRSSYENFRDWALINGYTDHLTIDRLNPNKNYCPSNCRWISGFQNSSRAHKRNAKLKLGGFSYEALQKRKQTNIERRGHPVKITKANRSKKFRSISEAAEHLAIKLSRGRVSCKAQIMQILNKNSRCTKIASYRVESLR